MKLANMHERIQRSPTALQLCASSTSRLLEADSEKDFLEFSLSLIGKYFGSQQISMVKGTKGQWRNLASVGNSSEMPSELLSETLDSQKVQSEGNYSAIPLRTRSDKTQSDELLVLRADQSVDAKELDSIAATLELTLGLYRRLANERRQNRRLGAMLDMTTAWSQSRETSKLLQTMAETSTMLLDAERATIFLWNRQSHELIGRPALGVESGELRIPESSGVVGQVIQTGEPHRVDHDVAVEQAQIDRATDQQLAFETKSLLCVPLRDSKQSIIGAFELINKRSGSFSDYDQQALEELANHAAIAIENTKYVEKVDSTRKHVANEAADKVHLIGDSPAMNKIVATIERLAPTELAVLILGENGTGKEVVAQMIHYKSQRRNNVMVAVNCAAIAETLLESELFGHEKGAFTDASNTRQGKFELADNGTLFLDEIGDMSPGGQAKLLRVLEDKVVVRIGGSVSIPTDVRVIAATNQDLNAAVAAKEFRQDLFFRLNVVTIELPPLRERGEDILKLAEHFLHEFSGKARRNPPQFTSAAKKRLLGHHWPGNVRELRNQMERLSYLHVGDKIDVDDLTLASSGTVNQDGIPMDLPLTDATRHFQCEYIDQHILRAGGNMTDAAEKLGLHRSNLYRKMKQLGMEVTGE